jgi:L-ribulose-5-phosphate 4-epimerase
MAQQEGTVKFQLDYTAGQMLSYEEIRVLNAWRKLFYATGLIGQDPLRYGGYGYGNVSQRFPPYISSAQARFAVSSTQTGELPELTAAHYCVVTECWPAQNRVVAYGPLKPSSESMTHGMVYRMDDAVRYVFHAHSPTIWHAASALDIPITSESVPYGTPEMAEEVQRLFRDTQVQLRGIFAMGGHEDGVVSFGRSAEEAGNVMIDCLVQAFAIK